MSDITVISADEIKAASLAALDQNNLLKHIRNNSITFNKPNFTRAMGETYKDTMLDIFEMKKIECTYEENFHQYPNSNLGEYVLSLDIK